MKFSRFLLVVAILALFVLSAESAIKKKKKPTIRRPTRKPTTRAPTTRQATTLVPSTSSPTTAIPTTAAPCYVCSALSPAYAAPIASNGNYINQGNNPYSTNSVVYITFGAVVGASNTWTLSTNGYYLSAQVGGGGFDSGNAASLQPFNQFLITPTGNNQFTIFSQYLSNYNGYGWMCLGSTPYGPYVQYCNGPYAWTIGAPPTTIAPSTPVPTTPALTTAAPTTPSPTTVTPAPCYVCSSLSASTAPISNGGNYINQGNNPYSTTAVVYITFAAVSGASNTWTLNSGGYYLSSKVGGGGFDATNTASGQSYNQFLITPTGNNQFTIFSQYLSSYNGYGWMCLGSTPYGPYVQYCNGPYAWTIGVPPTTPVPTTPPPPTTPAPTTPVPCYVCASLTASKTAHIANGGNYINQGNNPYSTTNPIYITFTAVSGASNTWNLNSGSYYLSAKVNGGGFDSTNTASAQSYNQFVITPTGNNQFTIFSQYLSNYNGYGWMCLGSTPYGPYVQYCNGPYSWTITP